MWVRIPLLAPFVVHAVESQTTSSSGDQGTDACPAGSTFEDFMNEDQEERIARSFELIALACHRWMLLNPLPVSQVTQNNSSNERMDIYARTNGRTVEPSEAIKEE